MTEIKRKKNFISSLKRKGKSMNEPLSRQASGGKLGKNGQVYQNDLLDSDYTSVTQTRKKLK
jgi:hypothetical protein